ncbi:MAG TPA: hypothetical protein PJ988_00535 [Anaerolinea sp.]|nr:hypothetical protein [Anaerolinea sp.]
MSQTDGDNLRKTLKRRMRAKLIINSGAGAAGELAGQLMDVIREMQAWKLAPQAFMIEPGCDLVGVVQRAQCKRIVAARPGFHDGAGSIGSTEQP